MAWGAAAVLLEVKIAPLTTGAGLDSGRVIVTTVVLVHLELVDGLVTTTGEVATGVEACTFIIGCNATMVSGGSGPMKFWTPTHVRSFIHF